MKLKTLPKLSGGLDQHAKIFFYFSLPYQVILRLISPDKRDYQLAFPTMALHQDERKQFLLHFYDLDSLSNSVRLFVDCVNVGVDKTEIPIREILSGNVSAVSVCDIKISHQYSATRLGLLSSGRGWSKSR